MADDQIFSDYESLLIEIERIRLNDVGLDAVENISNAMDVAEQLVEGVTKPREIGLDAKVFELSSVVLQQNAEKLDSTFKLLEFGENLVGILASRTQESSDACLWKGLSEYTTTMIRPRPAFDYMCGTYDREGFKPKERAQRSSQRNRDLSKDLVTALPQKLTQKEDMALGQQEILDKILQLIRKISKANGNKPVNYFEFVLNPDSFEETCQNILNVGFLIRDSFLQMFMEDDELLIVPYKPNRSEMEGVSKEECKRQIVIQLEKQDWRDLVELYHVTKPVIDFGLSTHNKPSKT